MQLIVLDSKLLIKTCIRCLITKSMGEFYKQSNTKDGYRGTCKTCQYKPRPSNFRAPKDAAYTAVYNSYKNSAKYRGLEFMLTVEQVTALIIQKCSHCGAPPIPFNPYQGRSHRTNGLKKARFEAAWIVKTGIDRVDNKVGYTFDNCIPCCSTCNYSRQDLSVSDWVEHCKKVYLSSLETK